MDVRLAVEPMAARLAARARARDSADSDAPCASSPSPVPGPPAALQVERLRARMWRAVRPGRWCRAGRRVGRV